MTKTEKQVLKALDGMGRRRFHPVQDIALERGQVANICDKVTANPSRYENSTLKCLQNLGPNVEKNKAGTHFKISKEGHRTALDLG